MRLWKNPEVARLFTFLACALILFLVLAFAISQVGMNAYKNALHTNQAVMIGAITGELPDVEAQVIQRITSPDAEAVSRGQALMSQYGIDADSLLTHTTLLRSSSHWNAALYIILTLVIFGSLVIMFYLFLRKQFAEIRQVNDYARHIADGHYSLDIRDNDEGDLSMLKNEIFKITSMLREQSEMLQKDKISLSSAIADISHQLKTPMTSLFVLNDLLETEPSGQVKKDFLRRMRSQLNRMEWLISSLLKLSKLDAGTVEMKRETIYVVDLLEHVLETLSIPLEIKMHHVTIKGAKEAAINVDINWTAEAFVNLLKNAIEHTPESGKIDIFIEENPLYTRMTISDSGVGIDPDDLPYVFQRFYKGKNANDDSVGIGLAMAYAIISKQGGHITVQSKRGCGTTFEMTFS